MTAVAAPACPRYAGHKMFRPTLSGPRLPGWFAKESVTFLAPDGQANVIASSEPLDPTIDTVTYARVQGDLLRREFPGYRELAFHQVSVLGSRPGFLREFAWTPPDGVSVTQVQTYHAEAGRGYTATATTTTTSFDRLRAELLEIVLGLRLEP